MPEYSAGKVTDYVDGDRRVVDCAESEVGIFKIDGEFFAWHNRCAHRAGPVCQGRIMKRVIEPVADDRTIRSQEYDQSETNIVCPWHGYEYNIKTGCHQGNNRIRLRKAEMTIRDGEIYVRI
jgi:nitrite reductase/ring-hydroxylating ferredoxin subunit